MKNIIFALVALLVSFSCAAKPIALDSAMSWLKVVDAGHYDKSWQQTGEVFQAQLSSQQWQQALNQVRSPLGKVTAREVATSKEFTSLPGVPDGQYLVLTLNTDFANKPKSVETITLVKSGDNWQPVGYFIR